MHNKLPSANTPSGSMEKLPDPNDYLNIYALPVGQGDCTIIQCPRGPARDASGRQLPAKERWQGLTIVDMGSSTTRKYMDHNVLRKFLGEQEVKYLFLSHPDKDHINLVDAIHREGVQQLVKEKIYHACKAAMYQGAGGLRGETRTWFKEHENAGKMQEVGKCIGIHSCKLSVPVCVGYSRKRTGSDSQKLSYYNMNVLASAHGGCPGTKGSNLDSLVLQLVTPGGFKVLLPGDFEDKRGKTEATDQLIKKNGEALKSDIYRLAHHGAYGNANKFELLNAIQPRFAFSSSRAPPGTYGHPRCQLFHMLKDIMLERGCHKAKQHTFSCAWDKKTTKKYTKVDIPLYSTAPEDHVHHVIHFIYDYRRPNDATVQTREFKKKP